MSAEFEQRNKAAANSSGARSDFLYGNILEQKRYIFTLEYVHGRDVLDCASGIGWGSFLMASAGASRVVGVELAAEAVDGARRHYAHPRVEYLNHSLEDAPLATASFDVLVSFETIEHVDDPAAFLARLRQLARPGATLLMSTPNAVVMKGAAPRPFNPYHAREFTREELTRLLGANGWNVKEYRGQFPLPTGSPAVTSYQGFIRRYWRQQNLIDRFGRAARVPLAVWNRIGTRLVEPAFASDCNPVLIGPGMEPAYHYFVLSAA